jgi:hypothetical protein
VTLPQDALQQLQRRLATTAAIQKSVPQSGAGKRKNRRRWQRSGGGAPTVGAKPAGGGGNGNGNANANGNGGRTASAPADRQGQ